MGSMEGHDAHQAKPLTPSEVKDEAHKLEGALSKFRGSHDDVDAFKALHNTVTELQSHGLNSVKEVFQQMQTDSKGVTPLLPNVTFNESKDENGNRQLELLESPSIMSRLGGAGNGTFLASVNAREVHTIIGRGKDGAPGPLIEQGNSEFSINTHEIEGSTKQSSGDNYKKPYYEE